MTKEEKIVKKLNKTLTPVLIQIDKNINNAMYYMRIKSYKYFVEKYIFSEETLDMGKVLFKYNWNPTKENFNNLIKCYKECPQEIRNEFEKGLNE